MESSVQAPARAGEGPCDRHPGYLQRNFQDKQSTFLKSEPMKVKLYLPRQSRDEKDLKADIRKHMRSMPGNDTAKRRN